MFTNINAQAALLIMVALSISGCATLPSSGPTSFKNSVQTDQNYKVVDINTEIIGQLNVTSSLPTAGGPPITSAMSRLDIISRGDILTVQVHEVGLSLFGGGGSGMPLMNDLTSNIHREQFSGVLVDQDGMISLPYIGRLPAAGVSTRTLQGRIEQSMIGKSQSPQALVSIVDSPLNSAFIFGAVRAPGRMKLSPAGDRLLDTIAVAGGAVAQSYDTIVRITRNDLVSEARLSSITNDSSANIQLISGDRIELVHQELSFTVLGAANKVSQQPFDAERINLAEAIAKVGGLNDQKADPKAIYLFRNSVIQPKGEPLTIYRLNFTKPEAFFLAKSMQVKDGDLIYIANAKANLPVQFISFLNQLFTPLVMIRAVTN